MEDQCDSSFAPGGGNYEPEHGNTYQGFYTPEDPSYLNTSESEIMKYEPEEKPVVSNADFLTACEDIVNCMPQETKSNENGELPMSLLLQDETKRSADGNPDTDAPQDNSCGDDCFYLTLLCCECSIL